MTGFFAMSLVDSTGAENKVDVSALVANPATYISGKINAADPLDRWYPIQELKELTDERAESVFQEFADGSKFFVKKGQRTVTATKPKASTRWIKSLDGFRCAPNFGIIAIDNNNQLIGKRISDTDLDMYPVQVEKGSFEVGLNKATDVTLQNAIVTFQFSPSEKDTDLVLIPADSISPARLSTYNGLLNVVSVESSISTTGFTLTLGVIDSNIVANVPVTGLVVGDLALYNVTDVASITPTSMTETSDGVYVVVMPAQTSADVVRVTLTKNGYDFTAVTANTVLIP